MGKRSFDQAKVNSAFMQIVTLLSALGPAELSAVSNRLYRAFPPTHAEVARTTQRVASAQLSTPPPQVEKKSQKPAKQEKGKGKPTTPKVKDKTDLTKKWEASEEYKIFAAAKKELSDRKKAKPGFGSDPEDRALLQEFNVLKERSFRKKDDIRKSMESAPEAQAAPTADTEMFDEEGISPSSKKNKTSQ